jgi:hypothetical protein
MSTTFQLSYTNQNDPQPKLVKTKNNSLQPVFGPVVETTKPRKKALPGQLLYKRSNLHLSSYFLVNPVTGQVLGCGLQARKEARPPPGKNGMQAAKQ